MKLILTIALYGVLAGLIATQSRADDIDIYRAGTEAALTRVMFAIDLRAEGAEMVCSDAAAQSCETLLGSELYTALDLFGFDSSGAGAMALQRSADGVADVIQGDPDGVAESITAGHWSGVAVDRYDVLRAALSVVLTDISENLQQVSTERRIEVGLMATHAEDCAGAGPQFSPRYELRPAVGCSQGAYVLRGFTDLAVAENLDKLLAAIAALPDPGSRAPWMAEAWRGHPYKLRDIYLELYRYLSGQAVFNGFLGTSDYGSRLSGNLYHRAQGNVINDVLLTSAGGSEPMPLLSPDLDILQSASFALATDSVSAARYQSPIGEDESCPDIAMVNLLSGDISRSHPDTNTALSAARSSGGLELNLAPGEAGDRDLLAALALAGIDGTASSEDIVATRSYFFVQDTNAANEAMAQAGGTGHAIVMDDPRELLTSLRSVFNRANGGSRSLGAGSMVVNEANQRSVVRDIYFALFQPEPAGLWPGNIKKLKIAAGARDASEEASPALVSQAPLTEPPRAALSVVDGQILPDALTFWTDPEGADVLAYDASRQQVSGRDGRSVTRGGAGQQVTGFLQDSVGASNGEPGARQLFTSHPLRPGETIALDASAATLAIVDGYLDPDSQLGQEEKLSLIRWIRGQDSFDADRDGDRFESRRWLLAAPLHSRPLAISYGARPGTAFSANNPDVRIFFGTTDGMFHMLQNTAESGAESGRETWAFVPHELLGLQAVLAGRRNGAYGSPSYGLDGEAVALIEDRDRDGNIENSEGDSVRVFIGQRRGGRGIFAFDMTDPDDPHYLWSISNLTPGFEQLALTFSTPRVAHLDLGGSAPTPMLVFAGGYNGGWKGSMRAGKDAGGGDDLVGNAIYVVDPADGSLLWRAVGPGEGTAAILNEDDLFVAELTESIPSPLTLLDADNNGVHDRAYVGDSGGNIWRIDFTELQRPLTDTDVAASSNWHLTRLATLGGAGQDDRRFFHAPDVAQSRDGSGEYDGVLIVSGDRAAPRELEVRNFAYLLKDRHTARSGESVAQGEMKHMRLADITDSCKVAASDVCTGSDFSLGWRLELLAPGEKGLSTPVVSNGKVVFTSYVPYAGKGLPNSPDQCGSQEGFGRLYAVHMGDGSSATPALGKLRLEEEPAEDTELAVSERYQSIGSGLPGDVVPIGDQLLIPGAGIEEQPLLSISGRTWWRSYWREEEVDTF